MMKRVEANDPASMCQLGCYYYHGHQGIHQDYARSKELYTRAAELGNSYAHFNMAGIYRQGGDLKKAKFDYEAAAMAGHELARNNLGCIEGNSGNMEGAVKH